jgi:clan AA aspartic protease
VGATYVNVTVRNPAEPQRAWEGRFLVDTGASHSMVPGTHLDAIGVSPEMRRDCEMADGSVEAFGVGGARLDFMGRSVWGSVVFGPDDAEPLLGFIALEDAQMEVDPHGERLKPQPRPRFKYGLHNFVRQRPEPDSPSPSPSP